MLAVQLHALAAAVFVDLEAIGEPYAHARPQLRILVHSADIAEGDRLDAAARRLIRRSQPHFQMPAADDTRIDDLEIPIEYRLRKALSPETTAAQHPGGV